ncbi:MAG: hypothetical protein WCT20_01275 [Candidatus Babeliales bacterium]
MNKLLPLLFVSFAIATTPFQPIYSCLSKKEAQQARRVATQHEDFLATHFDQCKDAASTWSSHAPKSQALICLLMVYLLLSQSYVDALPDQPTQGNGHQVQRHYVAESLGTWLWRLHNEAWGETFHPDKQQHTVEEFINGLVSRSRAEYEDDYDDEKRNNAIIDYLEEAEGWGFAVESFSYAEGGLGVRAKFVLRHFLAHNDPSVDNLFSGGAKLAQSLAKIHSIISNHDVVSYNMFGTDSACASGGIRPCFDYTEEVSFVFNLPLLHRKYRRINIVRPHNNVPLNAEPSKETQQEHREDL